MSLSNGRSRVDLLREADAARTKLLGAVEELERRGRRAIDLRTKWRRAPLRVLAEGGMACLTIGVSAALVWQRIATVTVRRRRERWALARSVWRHPSRELRARRGSFAVEVFRSTALAITTAAVLAMARQVRQVTAGLGRSKALPA